MGTENSNEVYVDVNTDDLDAFNDLLTGKAKPTPEEPIVEEPSVNTDANTESNPLAPENDDIDNELSDPDPEEKDETLLKVKKKKKTFQERINELTAQAREAERREAETARKLEELMAAKQTEPEPKTPEPVAAQGPDPDALLEDGSPKYPLGDLDPSYLRDYAKFTVEQETKAFREQEAKLQEQKQLEAIQAQLYSEWENKLTKAEETYPDLREKGANLEGTFEHLNPAYGEYLASTIMAMEHGPDVLYYLANNLDEARKIVEAGPAGATLALGRLEARFVSFEEEKATKKLKVSQAPEPPPQLNRGVSPTFDTPADTDNLEDFEKVFYRKK